MFNFFFSQQCSPVLTVSSVTLISLTENRLSSYQFLKGDILKIINSLDSNKAHGYDMIRICMLKLCGESDCRPLDTIYKTCLESVNFPSEWKKANVFPVHKKGDKQTVLHLSICRKLFIWILYMNNDITEFFAENNLISSNQLDLRHSDSVLNILSQLVMKS